MEINTTFLLPLGAMFVLLIIFRVIIFNAFVKLTSKTKSKHDDRIAEKLKRPLTLIPIGIGLYLLNDSLNLPESIAAYSTITIQTFFYVVIFLSIAPIVDPIKDYVGEKYNFLSPTLRNWVFRALKFVIYLLGVVSVLELWGIDAASVIAGLGLFSVALALGAQNFFKNLIGGLLIIGEKRFKQGDWINVEGVAEG